MFARVLFAVDCAVPAEREGFLQGLKKKIRRNADERNHAESEFVRRFSVSQNQTQRKPENGRRREDDHDTAMTKVPIGVLRSVLASKRGKAKAIQRRQKQADVEMLESLRASNMQMKRTIRDLRNDISSIRIRNKRHDVDTKRMEVVLDELVSSKGTATQLKHTVSELRRLRALVAKLQRDAKAREDQMSELLRSKKYTRVTELELVTEEYLNEVTRLREVVEKEKQRKERTKKEAQTAIETSYRVISELRDVTQQKTLLEQDVAALKKKLAGVQANQYDSKSGKAYSDVVKEYAEKVKRLNASLRESKREVGRLRSHLQYYQLNSPAKTTDTTLAIPSASVPSASSPKRLMLTDHPKHDVESGHTDGHSVDLKIEIERTKVKMKRLHEMKQQADDATRHKRRLRAKKHRDAFEERRAAAERRRKELEGARKREREEARKRRLIASRKRLAELRKGQEKWSRMSDRLGRPRRKGSQSTRAMRWAREQLRKREDIQRRRREKESRDHERKMSEKRREREKEKQDRRWRDRETPTSIVSPSILSFDALSKAVKSRTSSRVQSNFERRSERIHRPVVRDMSSRRKKDILSVKRTTMGSAGEIEKRADKTDSFRAQSEATRVRSHTQREHQDPSPHENDNMTVVTLDHPLVIKSDDSNENVTTNMKEYDADVTVAEDYYATSHSNNDAGKSKVTKTVSDREYDKVVEIEKEEKKNAIENEERVDARQMPSEKEDDVLSTSREVGDRAGESPQDNDADVVRDESVGEMSDRVLDEQHSHVHFSETNEEYVYEVEPNAKVESNGADEGVSADEGGGDVVDVVDVDDEILVQEHTVPDDSAPVDAASEAHAKDTDESNEYESNDDYGDDNDFEDDDYGDDNDFEDD